MGLIPEVLAFRLRRRANAAPLILVAVSTALIIMGASRTHEVRTIDADELAEFLDFTPFEDISDYQLTIDPPLTGVASSNEHLYSTYDRGLPDQKRPCPT